MTRSVYIFRLLDHIMVHFEKSEKINIKLLSVCMHTRNRNSITNKSSSFHDLIKEKNICLNFLFLSPDSNKMHLWNKARKKREMELFSIFSVNLSTRLRDKVIDRVVCLQFQSPNPPVRSANLSKKSPSKYKSCC